FSLAVRRLKFSNSEYRRIYLSFCSASSAISFSSAESSDSSVSFIVGASSVVRLSSANSTSVSSVLFFFDMFSAIFQRSQESQILNHRVDFCHYVSKNEKPAMYFFAGLKGICFF